MEELDGPLSRRAAEAGGKAEMEGGAAAGGGGGSDAGASLLSGDELASLQSKFPGQRTVSAMAAKLRQLRTQLAGFGPSVSPAKWQEHIKLAERYLVHLQAEQAQQQAQRSAEWLQQSRLAQVGRGGWVPRARATCERGGLHTRRRRCRSHPLQEQARQQQQEEQQQQQEPGPSLPRGDDTVYAHPVIPPSKGSKRAQAAVATATMRTFGRQGEGKRSRGGGLAGMQPEAFCLHCNHKFPVAKMVRACACVCVHARARLAASDPGEEGLHEHPTRPPPLPPLLLCRLARLVSARTAGKTGRHSSSSSTAPRRSACRAFRAASRPTHSTAWAPPSGGGGGPPRSFRLSSNPSTRRSSRRSQPPRHARASHDGERLSRTRTARRQVGVDLCALQLATCLRPCWLLAPACTVLC